MDISVIGMGYVGCVSAACLARDGHTVIGVESDKNRYSQLDRGIAPIAEAGLPELIARAREAKRLRMADSIAEAVRSTDISLICVGTPGNADGSPDTAHVQSACEEIGAALKTKAAFHVVTMRSTVLPGTMKGLIIPTLEKCSGGRAGIDFGVCNNPEFMREGTAVHDYFHPPRIVIGATDRRSGDRVQSLYEGISAPVMRCPIQVGEMVKYADNAWHAVKVSFANEIGRVCKAAGIDSHEVMDIFCKDTRLNLSSAYLKPGFAFGGSCLPKDMRALSALAGLMGVETPLLSSTLLSNAAQIQCGLEMILAQGKKKIGFLGVSFKAGTDDMRESPILEIMRHLAQSGFDICFYEPQLSGERGYALSGAHVRSIDALLQASEVIVIGNNAPEFGAIEDKLRPEQTVIDFVRIAAIERVHADYHGICW